jgi:hypothetical protein
MQNEKLSVTLDNPNLPNKNPGCVELPIEFYKAWHSFDFVSSYANLRPKAEPRLNEIYRKFSKKIKEFESEFTAHQNLDAKPIDLVREHVND